MLDDRSRASSELAARLQAVLGTRYAVEREVGRGGMGTVFLARELKFSRPVAIKLLHPELATSVAASRFLSEIRTAANLTHPHIVTVFESGEAAGLLYYVMPYIDGESLRHRLDRDGRLPVEHAVRIAADVARALAFAHQRGVVHRDIKPENVLLGEDGHASVADFGVARAIAASGDERLTSTGLILGSPTYMSPEQADAAAPVDGRADVYSLGCVLHEMLAGSPPFGANGPRATLYRHLTQTPEPLRSLRPEVPAAVEAAVLRALEKDPARRFVCASEFATALVTGTVAPAPSPRPGLRARLRVPGRRGAWAALAGAALAAVALLVVPRLAARDPASVGVMVLPFDAGSELTVGGLRREPAPDLWLAGSLALLPVVRVIDSQLLTGNTGDWRASPVEEVYRRVARHGAQYVVTGSYLQVGSERRLTVAVFATRGGGQLYHGPALGGESPTQALDRMALEIVRVVARAERLELGSFGDLASTTTSLVALTELLQGQEKLWAGDTDAAVAAFQRAIAADSAFGPAYYRLSVAESWTPRFDYDAALSAAEAGLRRAGEMPPRWAELLAAQRHYVRRNTDSAQFQFQKVLGENPQLPDALLGAGEVLFHNGGMLGQSPTTALPAFERLVEADSTFIPIQSHIVDLALYRGDERLARRYLPQLDSSRRAPRALAVELHFGSGGARAQALRTLRSADRGTVAKVVDLFLQEGLNPTLADIVASFLTDTARHADDRLRGAHFRLAALAGQGRWEEGVRIWEGIGGGRPFDAWIVHGYLAGHPVERLAQPMLAWARAQVESGAAPTFAPLLRGEARGLELRDAFRGLVHLATLRGDSAEVVELIRSIDDAAPGAAAVDPEPDALRASLRARLALLAGDTSGAIAQLERAVARAPWTFSLAIPLADAAPQRLLLAELLAARGDPAGAERRLRSFGRVWCAGDAIYLPAVARLRARLATPSRPPRAR